jgi:hypothetical protein
MFKPGHKKIARDGSPNTGKSYKTLSKEMQKHGKYLEGALSSVKSHGRDLYVLYITKNVYLTARQAIIAQCAHCMGWYADGRHDCENHDCPLYPYMPYGKYRKVRIQKSAAPVPGNGGS